MSYSYLYVLPESHYPNLVSRFRKLMLGRLSADWQSVWRHPVALAESFVDPNLYRGTAYQVSGWSQLGHTQDLFTTLETLWADQRFFPLGPRRTPGR